MGFLWDDRMGGRAPPLMGKPQPMSQVAGRAPARPMPSSGQPQPAGRGQPPPMDPMQAKRMISARKMMLQSELLKIRAVEAMMGGSAQGKKPRRE